MKNKQNRLVVADAGWAQSIPEWILEAIKVERLLYGMGEIINPDKKIVGDAEILAYLYTASLRHPISHEDGEIHIYLTGKLMQKYKGIKIEDMPDFIQEQLKRGLSEDAKREYARLGREIYKARGGEIHCPLLDILKELKKGKCR